MLISWALRACYLPRFGGKTGSAVCITEIGAKIAAVGLSELVGPLNNALELHEVCVYSGLL